MATPTGPSASPPVFVPSPGFAAPGTSVQVPDTIWSRISNYASEHKAMVYTIGAVVVVATAGGLYYVTEKKSSAKSKAAGGATGAKEEKGKKEKKRKEKKDKKKKDGAASPTEEQEEKSQAPKPEVEESEEDKIPEITEELLATLSEQQRKDYAGRLKAMGNRRYGFKDYDNAIHLYSQAILCKPDPIFYSNRSACYNALGKYENVIEDCTAAIALDPEYVKCLNRRSSAYEHLEMYSEALIDSTASCIIDQFRNEAAAQAVERLLKKVAETKGKKMLEGKPKRLPSATFVTNFLQSFRPKPRPEGLEDSAALDEEFGDFHLRKGMQCVARKTADAYEEAAQAFAKAVELGTSAKYASLAHNWRGTFNYLRGHTDAALADYEKSIELDPTFTQSYIKQASMRLELGDREGASQAFDLALQQNKDDPDIYYYRAQLYFIAGEFAEAAKDYQQSIDLDPEFIFSHIQLGVTQYKWGSIASSMATFRKCIRDFENVPEVYNYYGELLLDQQKFSEAVQNFEKSIQMEKAQNPTAMNVLPLINKALAVFQWRQDYVMAEDLCKTALIIDPECDIAVATMAQLLLQQQKVKEALEYFERAAELSRTEGEIVNALSYAEATRAQLQVQEKYPKLAERLQESARASAGIA